MIQPEKFPLHWPQGYPVTEYRTESKFKCTFAEARDGIYYELDRLGSEAYFISCNINRNKSGQLIAGRLVYDNPGVAVYFKYNGEQKVIACDKWKYIHENLRAIEKSLEAIRGLDRWGCTNIISQAVSGMKELPMNAGNSSRSWWQVLEALQNSSDELIENNYKRLRKQYHPDMPGGDNDKFVAVQKAYEEYKAIFK